MIREEVLKHWKGGVILFDDGAPDHRGLAIRAACDLEAELVSLLAEFLVKDKGFELERGNKEFEDWGLKKLADLAFMLNFISNEDRHDIRKVSRLRDRYAHDKRRGQLDEDEEMFAFLKNTYLFRGSIELRQLNRQEVLFCIRDELLARVQDAASRFTARPRNG